MKRCARTLILFSIVPVAVFAIDALFVIANADIQRDIIPDQYIVVLKDNVADVDRAEADIVGYTRGIHTNSYRTALHGFSGRFSQNEIAEIRNDPRVAFVSEDHIISIDVVRGERDTPLSQRVDASRRRSTKPPPNPTPIPAPAPTPAPVPSTQVVPSGVDRINAENLTNKGFGQVVAVIDSGVDTNHPDLKGQMYGGRNCTTPNTAAYSDENGHGTHVAGTIAASNNTIGVVGVAPGAKIASIRVLDKNGSGSWSSVICGLDAVAANGPTHGGAITVANMSLGGSGVSDNNCGLTNNDALHAAICRVRDAGVTIIVAAGNSGVNSANFIPAAYDDAVITVSALTDTDGKGGALGLPTNYGGDDTFASFSNFGSPVDIAAPGVNIYSTKLGGGYTTMSGTSMASPHAAGAAALYLATHPGAAWTAVRSALISVGELNGAGHTDPSGKHPEPFLRVDAL
jgi:subtilisin family serine protease